ncbi:MAG: hypothetical protein MUE80_05455 [Acidobacteria bacterium]|nr:hypothetical protein [Acidobacteriota bacterium]
MTVLKLAVKNLLGAGLRTWLNVFVLSLSFVLIIFTQGLLEGMNKQAEEAMIAAEVAGGHVQHPAYDPYDPLSLTDAHGPVPAPLAAMAAAGKAAPVLVIQGTIYPGGRLFTVRVKGIEPGQTVVDMPTAPLAAPAAGDEVPVLVGERMARMAGLKQGDTFRRDHEDLGPVDRPGPHLGAARAAARDDGPGRGSHLRRPGPGRRPARGRSRSRRLGLSRPGRLPVRPPGHGRIQDRRQLHPLRHLPGPGHAGHLRHPGPVHLPPPPRDGLGLFTLEGALNGVLAALVAAVYGIPLLSWMARTGWALPGDTDSYGFAIGERLFPSYGAGLVAGTTLIVLLTTAVVSFLPTRRIAKLKPTDALRGRLS